MIFGFLSRRASCRRRNRPQKPSCRRSTKKPRICIVPPEWSALNSTDGITSIPSRSPSAAASSSPSTQSWSVRANARSFFSAAYRTSCRGLRLPSEAVLWVWRSIHRSFMSRSSAGSSGSQRHRAGTPSFREGRGSSPLIPPVFPYWFRREFQDGAALRTGRIPR